MMPSPHARKPRHLDIVISSGSHAATGQLGLILFNADNTVREYPLLFLKETDTDFSELRATISGLIIDPEICIMPLGSLRLVWKSFI